MRPSLCLSFLIVAGCAPDYSVSTICVQDAAGFDVEEVSTLQDAAGYPNARDAIVLDFDDSALTVEDSWRIKGIDLLAMVPEWVFDEYDGGDVIRIDIWDDARPMGEGDWFVELPIEPDSLDWTEVSLTPNAYWAGLRQELDQRRAWMNFDFSDVIPEDGMSSTTYTIAVSWRGDGLPTIGYSNFNLACDRNWTDYGDGQWTLNSADGDQDECSWPMMRVHMETRTITDEGCAGTTEAI